MEFLRLFLGRHLAEKSVVALPNVGCFLRLTNSPRSIYQNSKMIPVRLSGHFSIFGLVFYTCLSSCNFVPKALESRKNLYIYIYVSKNVGYCIFWVLNITMKATKMSKK